MSKYRQAAFCQQNRVLRDLGIISHLQEERNLKSQLKLDELRSIEQQNANNSVDNINTHNPYSNNKNQQLIYQNLTRNSSENGNITDLDLPSLMNNKSSQQNQKSLYSLTKNELDHLKFKIRVVNTNSHKHNKNENHHSKDEQFLLDLSRLDQSKIGFAGDGGEDSEGVLRQSYYDKAAVLKGLDKDLSFPRLKRFKIRQTINNRQYIQSNLQQVETGMVESRILSSRESSNMGSNNLFSPSRFTVPSLDQMIKRQIQDLRDRIMDYKVLASENQFQNKKQAPSQQKIPNHSDIIIFGPTGSGKSSLIRTFYRALYDTKVIPSHLRESLAIKDKNSNEGTTQYTAVLIKKRTRVRNNGATKLGHVSQQVNSARETTTLETFHLPNAGRNFKANPSQYPQIQPRDETFSQHLIQNQPRPSVRLNQLQASPSSGDQRISQSSQQSKSNQDNFSVGSILNQDLNEEQAHQIIDELLENKSDRKLRKQLVEVQLAADKEESKKAPNQRVIIEVSGKKQQNKKKKVDKSEYSSAIIMHDTRGQIWMDENEKQQLDLLLKGKVKDKNMVQQRNYRYAYMLWEFWKRDQELFPSNIIQKGKSIKRKPHCIIFVFDGSIDEIPNGEEETNFFRETLQRCRHRKYMYPQIVLTCADKIEEQLVNEYKQERNQLLLQMEDAEGHVFDEGQLDFDHVKEENKQNYYQDLNKDFQSPSKLGKINLFPSQKPSKMNLMEQEQRLRDIMDLKIEKVALNLGVPRSSVHFIENYKSQNEEQQIRIDYKALRLLHECLLQADSYIQSQINSEKSKCTIF